MTNRNDKLLITCFEYPSKRKFERYDDSDRKIFGKVQKMFYSIILNVYRK